MAFNLLKLQMKNNSCLAAIDASITIAQAKKICFDTIRSNLTTQVVDIKAALNRVIATDIIANYNVPAHANSAMDGYALQKSDLVNNKLFEVIGCAYAGKPCNDKIGKNQAIQIMTGAIIPNNCDIVVPQEFVKKNAQQIVISYQGADNIRFAGDDLSIGDIVIQNGRLLNAPDLGLLASLGIAKVTVARRLKVGFFSTGDELCQLGDVLEAGQIYDSNRYSLYGLLTALNVEVVDMGVIKDNPQDLEQALLQAAKNCDAIITTGGVSVGEADFIKQVLAKIGKINFFKLAIKPGRPFTFGTINNTCFFGLPGNPVATVVTFYQLVQPFLKKMMGQTQNIEPLLVQAVSLTDIRKLPGRKEFIRANLINDNGVLKVNKLKKQGSGVLSSITNANCFIVLTEELSSIKAGDVVAVQPFYALA